MKQDEKLFEQSEKQEISTISEEEGDSFTNKLLQQSEEDENNLVKELLSYSEYMSEDMLKKIYFCLADQNLICYNLSETLKKKYKKVEMQLKSKDNKFIYFARLVQKPVIAEIYVSRIKANVNKTERNALIYALYTEEKHTQEFIAKIFNLSQSTICNIIKNFSYEKNVYHPRLEKLTK